MTSVELIYDHDCPNVSKARAHLLHALVAAGLSPRWSEWERGHPESPSYVRGYGSPTVLVEGKDVAGATPSDGVFCCRLYADPSGGFQGVPSVRLIESALLANSGVQVPVGHSARIAGWRSSLATAPGIALAFLPKVACPACWPAYAGILSSLGLGFLLNTVYLLPLTLLFLVVAVGALGLRARMRRGYGPFAAGLLASGIVIVGKFVLGSDPAMYVGIALLVTASLWNGWPHRTKRKGSCPACVPAGAASRRTGT